MSRNNSTFTTQDSTLKRVFLSPPHMSGEEMRFVREAFDSNYVAPLGPMVDAFEQECSEKVVIPNAVAVASNTAAMPWWNMPHRTGQAFHGVSILRCASLEYGQVMK